MEPGRHHVLGPVPRQHVARELPDGELVEGHVRVECVHHPVTVGPDAARGVNAVAVAVRIACLVQPPAAPALAMVRGGEEVDDEVLDCRLGEGLHVGSGWRQPSEVEREAADESGGLGAWGRLDALLGKGGVDEGVNRIPAFLLPLSSLRNALWRHEGPMCPHTRLFVRRSFCALGNPAREERHLLLGQRIALVGHLRVVAMRATQKGHKQARVRSARGDGCPAVSTFMSGCGGVEAQAGFGIRCAVTLHAGGGEERLHLTHVVHRRLRERGNQTEDNADGETHE